MPETTVNKSSLTYVNGTLFNVSPGLVHKPPTQSHFITLTLKPKYYKLPVREQCRKALQAFLNISQELYKHTANAIVELTEDCNVHLHLWLKSEYDCVRYMLIEAWRKIGIAKITKQAIKTEASVARVHEYMKKQAELRERILSGEITSVFVENNKNKPEITINEDHGLDDIVISNIKLVSEMIEQTVCEQSERYPN